MDPRIPTAEEDVHDLHAPMIIFVCRVHQELKDLGMVAI
jgi:hypothetical protein